MAFPVAAAIGAGALAAGIWGSERANSANQAMNYQNNMFNAEEAQKARDYNYNMTTNAWRNTVSDMKGAGINPMLAISQGTTSSPGSPTAQAQGAIPKINSVAQGLSSSGEMMRVQKELDLADSQEKLNAANAQTSNTQAVLNLTNSKFTEGARTESEWQKAGESANSANLKYVQMKAAKSQLEAVAARAEADKKHAIIDSKMATADAIGSRAGKVINSAAQVLSKGRAGLNARDREELDLHRSGSRGVPVKIGPQKDGSFVHPSGRREY